MNIYEHHEIKGWFFLPEDKDNPEKWVPGILKWDPAKGAEIELMGGLFPGFSYKDVPADQTRRFTSLEGTSNADFGIITLAEEISSIPVIFLETKEGKKYSIWDAQRGNYSFGLLSERTKEEHWHSMQVYVDDHILPEEKIFTKATFYIDELYYLVNDGRILPPEWCQMKGVEQPGEKLENGTFLTPYILPILGGFRAGKFEGDTEDAHYSINTFATRPWISEATEKDPSLKLNFMLKHQRHGLVLPISVDASISITLRKNGEETKDLEGTASEFLDKLAPIHDLMRLATFQPCGVASIQLQQRDNKHGSLLVNLGEVARPNEHHEQLDVVFTLNDVSLENFLKERECLTNNYGASESWYILMGLCGYSSNYMEEYISQSFAAAEGFHKLCLGKGKKYTDSNGRNKYFLKNRLKELYLLLPREIQAVFNFDIDEWATLAANARHRVAHGGPLTRNDSTTLLDRYAFAISVHLVTYLLVLTRLGILSDNLCNLLIEHSKIRTMRYYCDDVRSMLETKHKRICLLKLMQKRIQTMSEE